MLHTILGANGTIATELVPLLLDNKEQIRFRVIPSPLKEQKQLLPIYWMQFLLKPLLKDPALFICWWELITTVMFGNATGR